MVRQLTAIMFTDMVGYAALMQENEHRAMLNRPGHAQVLEASIAQRGGRILQFYSDDTLSVFRSALGAVLCGSVQIRSNPRFDELLASLEHPASVAA